MPGFPQRCAMVAMLSIVGGYLAAPVLPASRAERIELAAHKFAFSSSEIRLVKGKPVTLALTSSDFVHGFSVPELNIRVDLVPGKTVEVAFTPTRSGRFVFLCDNFCGEGHDRMSGMLIVTDD